MDNNLKTSLASLESIVRRQLQVHEELLGLMNRKRDALRDADASRLTELCQLENEKVQAISELEKQRLELVAHMTLLLQAEAPEPMTMNQLADYLPAQAGDKLRMLRHQLHEGMLQVRQQTAIALRATETLMRHMQGLLQSVATMSNGTATYASSGTMPARAGAISTFNMTA
jgi:hypothetical protein